MAAQLTVWRRNAGQLFFSLVTTGLVTVAAQDFFARAAPASKERWLAVTLLLGTLAAIAGIRLGQRLRLDGAAARVGLCAAIVALTAGLGAIAAPLLYVAVHLVVRGLINLGVQVFDARAAALAGGDQRRPNDHASTSLRFLGMLAGPLVFGAVAGGRALGGAALLVAGLCAGWAALALVGPGGRAPAAPAAPHAPQGGRPGAPPPGLRLLLAGALAFYAGNVLLASSLAFLAADVYAIADPAAHAGRLMTVVYGATVLVSLAIAGRGLRVGPAWALSGGVALVITGLGIERDAAASPWVQTGVCALLGGSFALFLLAVREAVGRAAQAGHAGALAAFNNLGNTSALAAFSLMIALVELGRAAEVAFVTMITWGIGGLALLGLLAVGLALGRGVGGAAVSSHE